MRYSVDLQSALLSRSDRATLVQTNSCQSPITMSERNGLMVRAQTVQSLPREDAGGMAVAPGDLQGVVAGVAQLGGHDVIGNPLGLDDPLTGDLVNALGTGALGPHEFEGKAVRRAVGPGDLEGTDVFECAKGLGRE